MQDLLDSNIFKNIFDSNPNGIAIIDTLTHRFLKANNSFLTIVEYKEEELLLKSLKDITLPKDIEKEKIHEYLNGSNINYVTENRFTTKSGNIRYAKVTWNIFKNNNGESITVVNVVDITNQKKAEEEAENREALLNQVFDLLPIGLWFADKNGKLLRGNPAGIEIWGAQPTVGIEEYGIFKARKLPSKEPIKENDWALIKSIKEGITVKDELLEIDTFDGKKKTILNYTAPVFDNDNKILGAIVLNTDITKLHKSVERIEHLNLVLKAIRNVNQLITKEKNRTKLIKGACDNLIETRGYVGAWIAITDKFGKFIEGAESGIGEKFHLLQSKLYKGQISYCIKKCMEQLNVITIESPETICENCPIINSYQKLSAMSMRLEYNNTIYGFISISVPKDTIFDDEEISLFKEVSEDISFALYSIESEETKKLFEKKQKMLSEMLDEAPNSITVHDTFGNFLYANKKTFSLHGYSKIEFMNLKLIELDVPESIELIRERINLIEKNGEATFEVMHYRKDRSTFPLEVYAKKVIWEEKKAILSIATDITSRKKSEESLQNVQKLEALGVLAGGIAHDFNNLLGAIFGYIDIAKDETKEQKTAAYISKAIYNIERAKDLTGQLLTFAKGGVPIIKTESLCPFLQNTVQFALSGSSISCQFYIEENLSHCNFDKNQIGQVIDNIIINAQQAMPNGGTISVEAKNIFITKNAHPILPSGNYVKITIKDEGIGIPKEFLPHIFDPFYTTKPKGHGLGLATSYSIISRHNGCIDVDSIPGKGTNFHVYLPATSNKIIKKPEIIRERHIGEGTFIIMDDEDALRATIGHMLESFGYNPILLSNGKDAIDYFKNEINAGRKIAGLIFDLTIPGGIGGKEAISEIRKICSNVPVFVMSGYASDPIIANPNEYGFNGSICKPFMLSGLSIMLNNYFNSNKSTF